MPQKKASPAQIRARERLAKASKHARIEYDKLPPNMQTASRWHELVRKNMKH